MVGLIQSISCCSVRLFTARKRNLTLLEYTRENDEWELVYNQNQAGQSKFFRYNLDFYDHFDWNCIWFHRFDLLFLFLVYFFFMVIQSVGLHLGWAREFSMGALWERKNKSNKQLTDTCFTVYRVKGSSSKLDIKVIYIGSFSLYLGRTKHENCH